jgi:DMSO/TMAO reductase YedYZ molybdopterin-dependent catalytic subunit
MPGLHTLPRSNPMKRKVIITGFLLGALTSIPVMLLVYEGDNLAGLPFVPFDLFDFLARVLPGFILVPSIHLMVHLLQAFHVASLSTAAKLAEQCMALILFIAASGGVGGILGVVAAIKEKWNLPQTGMFLGLAALVLAGGILFFLGFPPAGPILSLIWVGFLFVLWGSLIGWELRQIFFAEREPSPTSSNRRWAYHLIAVFTAAFLASGAGLYLFLIPREKPRLTIVQIPLQQIPAPDSTGISPGSLQHILSDSTAVPSKPLEQIPAAGSKAFPSKPLQPAQIEPAPGTRPEITPLKDFYRIDIDTRPPHVDIASWRLKITGLVDHPINLTLNEIRMRLPISQYATMSCISNPIGGPLISTGLWTGVPLIVLLKEAGVKPTAVKVYIEAVDGYFETVSQKDMTDPRTLLVYAINGEPLTAEQGYPLRIFVPNRYGMKSPKWIQSIEAIGADGHGFWVERGWDEAAVVQTTSVIDAVAVNQPNTATGAIPMGGIAYAGDRGIGKVEIQIDNGSWIAAKLKTPPLSQLSWVLWRYDWPPVSGKHMVKVRAYDGAGTVQTPQKHGEFPYGATGYHMVEFKI